MDLSAILATSLNGGGHAKAASAVFRMDHTLDDPALAALQETGDVDGILDHLVKRGRARQRPGRIPAIHACNIAGWHLTEETRL